MLITLTRPSIVSLPATDAVILRDDVHTRAAEAAEAAIILNRQVAP